MVEMSCEEHDRQAASTQFITHTVGRVLGAMDVQSTDINTKARRLRAARPLVLLRAPCPSPGGSPGARRGASTRRRHPPLAHSSPPPAPHAGL